MAVPDHIVAVLRSDRSLLATEDTSGRAPAPDN